MLLKRLAEDELLVQEVVLAAKDEFEEDVDINLEFSFHNKISKSDKLLFLC